MTSSVTGLSPPGTGTAAPVPPPRRGSRIDPLLGVIGIAGLVVVAELFPRTGLVDSRYLPPISAMLAELGRQAAEPAFWSALGSTLLGWGTGLAIALVAGTAVGIVIGTTAMLRAVTSSTIEFLRPIPSVALIPLAVLMFGTDMRSTLLLVVYAAFWQVLVQVLYGVADVDPVARETARSYRFRPWTRVRTVVWPTALPYVMTGFRLAAAVALILEVTGELIIGSPGLGREIAVAQSSGAVEVMYALVLVTGAIGVLVNLGARLVERRALRWHPSVRREVAA
ncbi:MULTISPECIES: ABC transporter permease [Pseudonocardia]|uniref:Nitrate ABC transporter permease n=2 Tax=Pseudonocardia TaxID=1847 RepID=A0ABQ0RRW4_9PSEU|nr:MULTISPECIES: ABC transporter permease [Pseudonocardia]OSY39054.1 putative aliphatic sulfonates transport permease protein SsuC [Pseudonocardia autotrophica]TDN71350.1 ABC-type nitrate/sulfonate/bicarbonate transport system permease component [Pseudonocardia autotrophica]BBG02025.1 nitrate ABC transporter permease [Pseudonocardia autotrophica]GEC23188.1 nitrate ABC transporter permease [Pseudonocardia saturnea]